MRVAVLFTDGVGIGPRQPATNPLMRGDFLFSQFDDGSGTVLPHDGRVRRVDATFGVAGRPQSASNQTAIYTGTDAPKAIGAHVLGFPNAPLRAILAEHSIVKRLSAAGRSASFANAFPAAYLAALGLAPSTEPIAAELPAKLRRRLRPSASSLAMAAGATTFRTFDDLRGGRALTHDIDGATASKRAGPLPHRTAREAAEIFWALSADFTLFEHFLADEAGHLQDLQAAERALATFDAFAREVIATRPADCALLLCSDHGNVEDLSSRNHTTNQVAVLTFGVSERLPFATVADVGRAALALLGVPS